ncbi:hypothetical protein V6N11_027234 [Hibiscus sabdariffa]|uniref:Uncharacterized protein n=1 Tax=Hibiscus sabdariffa TaxID=183260 RepID=A0ABR2PGP8_9ROSI
MAKIALFIVLVSMIMIHSAQVVVSDNEPSAAPIADVVAVAGPVSGSESSPAPAPTPETTTKGIKFDRNVVLQPCQSIGYFDGGHARKGGGAPCLFFQGLVVTWTFYAVLMCYRLLFASEAFDQLAYKRGGSMAS